MKRDRGEWTDAVGRSLRGAEEPLPQGGWERLERDLGASSPGPSVGSLRRKWIGYAAAAAAVLVCVSIGIQVIRTDRNVLKRVVISVSEAAGSGQYTDAGTAVADASGLTEAPDGTAAAGNRADETASGNALAAIRRSGDTAAGNAADGEPEANAASQAHAATWAKETAVQNAVSGEPHSRSSAVRNDAGTEPEAETRIALQDAAQVPYNSADYDGLFAAAESAPKSRGEAGFHAGGIFPSSGGVRGGNSAALLMLADGAASLREAYAEYSYKHKQPLSFGLTFRWNFKYGLSVESGLVYTLLRSDVAVPGGVRDVGQTLHFIGIPLRLNWEFLRKGRFSMYLGAGGMAEKCVSARFGREKVRERNVQWSVSGAVGAQYRLGRNVGIYFEPGISHYLTQTTLRTPYTDSSVNLNLQLGVRFSY